VGWGNQAASAASHTGTHSTSRSNGSCLHAARTWNLQAGESYGRPCPYQSGLGCSAPC